MRLSEDRINAIAYKIAFELIKKRYIKTPKRLNQVTAWVEKPILENIRMEETIEDDVRKMLAKMTSCPPEGSFEWQALFQKKKEEIANRHHYEL